MKRRIVENIARQLQALKVLKTLQLEEFAHLSEFRPQAVSAVEFSIQELVRQIHAERLDARRLIPQVRLGAARIADLREDFGEKWPVVEDLLARIDALEQFCAKQAEKSYKLALALFDQSGGYIDFFKQKLVPEKGTYGPRGLVGKAKPRPAMVKGAL